MSTIFIRDPDTTLAVDTRQFTLRAKGKRIGAIPPTMVDQVIVEHGVEITRKALERLGTLGIPVTFLGREGSVQARLVAPWKSNPASRLGQAAAYFDDSLRMKLARRWVDAKLANATTVLRRYLSNYRDPRLSEIAREIRKYRDRIPACEDTASLMGVEGIAARHWFEALGRMIRVSWLEFSGRNRGPPKDPGNAVLSYSYAVICHQLLACVEAIGLDPYVGYLHAMENRRPSLILDLMEPFRPALADRLMLRLLNLGILKPDHFYEPDGPGAGVRITRDARDAIVSVLADWMSSCDEALGPEFRSPGGLLLAEAKRFSSHAADGTLPEFLPYHMDESEIRSL